MKVLIQDPCPFAPVGSAKRSRAGIATVKGFWKLRLCPFSGQDAFDCVHVGVGREPVRSLQPWSY